MAAKPTVGGSYNTHGTELNAFLDVSHASDGKIKDGAQQSSSAAPTTDAMIANKKYVDDQTDNACKAWARIDSAGAIVGTGFNITPSRDSTGIYTLTWGTDFANVNYSVLITPLDGGSQATVVFQVISMLVGSCKVHFFKTSNESRLDHDFMVAAFGDQ